MSVFEITFGSAVAFPEEVKLSVGLGGSFTDLGSITNVLAAGGVAVATGVGVFDTVRLTDMSPFTSTVESDALGPLGGFDVDAVRVTPVPLPAGGLLLLTGLVGGLALRRRK